MNVMDLNLFAVFDAVMRHGSVTKAAQSLGLTQPATSNALSRLRGQLGDPLFVRSKNGMLPTRFARDMAPVVARALADLDAVGSAGETSVDLAELRRHVVLMMSDLEEVLFLDDLVRSLARRAPRVTLEVRAFRRDVLQEDLELEKLDFVMANLLAPIKNLTSRRLCWQDFVCVRRRRRGRRDEAISLADYVAHGHILVAPDLGGRRGVIDDHLRRMGERRQVVCSVPHFLSACLLVSRSDHLLTLPRRLAERAAGRFSLEPLELPFPTDGFPIDLHWLRTRDRDPEHAALRDFMLTELGAAS